MEQLTFIDQLLPEYGCQGLVDQTTLFNKSTVIHPTQLPDVINQRMAILRRVFPTKSLNLGRLNYQIQTLDQAVALLRGLLKIANIGYVIVRRHDQEFMRLELENKILKYYIIHQQMTTTKMLTVGFNRLWSPDQKQIVKGFYLKTLDSLQGHSVKLMIDGRVMASTRTYEWLKDKGVYEIKFFSEVHVCGEQIPPELRSALILTHMDRHQIMLYTRSGGPVRELPGSPGPEFLMEVVVLSQSVELVSKLRTYVKFQEPYFLEVDAIWHWSHGCDLASSYDWHGHRSKYHPSHQMPMTSVLYDPYQSSILTDLGIIVNCQFHFDQHTPIYETRPPRDTLTSPYICYRRSLGTCHRGEKKLIPPDGDFLCGLSITTKSSSGQSGATLLDHEDRVVCRLTFHDGCARFNPGETPEFLLGESSRSYTNTVPLLVLPHSLYVRLDEVDGDLSVEYSLVNQRTYQYLLPRQEFLSKLGNVFYHCKRQGLMRVTGDTLGRPRERSYDPPMYTKCQKNVAEEIPRFGPLLCGFEIEDPTQVTCFTLENKFGEVLCSLPVHGKTTYFSNGPPEIKCDPIITLNVIPYDCLCYNPLYFRLDHEASIGFVYQDLDRETQFILHRTRPLIFTIQDQPFGCRDGMLCPCSRLKPV